MPQDTLSAIFSSQFSLDISIFPELFWISSTLEEMFEAFWLAMNPCKQNHTICEENNISKLDSGFSLYYLHQTGGKYCTPACSSTHGIDSCFNGATLDLAAIWLTLSLSSPLCCVLVHAPKACSDLSENMHSIGSSLAPIANRLLWKDTWLSFVISWNNTFQCCWTSLGSVLSQWTLVCHKF